MNNYVDSYGRYHLKPVTETNPLPTNNAYLYTFFAAVVGLKVTLSPAVISDLQQIDQVPLSRHPGGSALPISHDEYVGAAGIGAAKRICEYGEKNYWQFCDIEGFIPRPRYLCNPFVVIWGFICLLREDNVRRAVIKYPSIWNFAFRHPTQHVYFYKRCAGQDTSLVEKIFFVLASISTIFREGEKVMLGFKLLRLSLEKENWADRLVHWIYDKRLTFSKECVEYFPEDHPILIQVNTLLTTSRHS